MQARFSNERIWHQPMKCFAKAATSLDRLTRLMVVAHFSREAAICVRMKKTRRSCLGVIKHHGIRMASLIVLRSSNSDPNPKLLGCDEQARGLKKQSRTHVLLFFATVAYAHTPDMRKPFDTRTCIKPAVSVAASRRRHTARQKQAE